VFATSTVAPVAAQRVDQPAQVASYASGRDAGQDVVDVEPHGRHLRPLGERAGQLLTSAWATVEPDTPTLTYDVPRSARRAAPRPGLVVGRLAPTPTVSLAPTAT
jgi:hypothetical protein